MGWSWGERKGDIHDQKTLGPIQGFVFPLQGGGTYYKAWYCPKQTNCFCCKAKTHASGDCPYCITCRKYGHPSDACNIDPNSKEDTNKERSNNQEDTTEPNRTSVKTINDQLKTKYIKQKKIKASGKEWEDQEPSYKWVGVNGRRWRWNISLIYYLLESIKAGTLIMFTDWSWSYDICKREHYGVVVYLIMVNMNNNFDWIGLHIIYD